MKKEDVEEKISLDEMAKDGSERERMNTEKSILLLVMRPHMQGNEYLIEIQQEHVQVKEVDRF